MRMAKTNLLGMLALTFGALQSYALPVDTVFRDTLWHWVFSDSVDATKPKPSTDLSAWLPQAGNFSVQYPDTDSVRIHTNSGAILPTDAYNAFLTYPYKMVDFSVQVTFRLPFSNGNSGLQFRSHCYSKDSLGNNCGPSHRVCGAQMDMGQKASGDIYNTCTGAIVNSGSSPGTTAYGKILTANSDGCRSTNLPPPAWNTLRLRVKGDTASTFLNEVLCNRIVLTADGMTGATTMGIFAWQYETKFNVEWKNVKIKNLNPSVTTRVFDSPFREGEGAGSGADARVRQAGRHSLAFEIAEAGTYSLQVLDINGNRVGGKRGQGPASIQSFDLGKPGIYIVSLATPKGASLRKIYVP